MNGALRRLVVLLLACATLGIAPAATSSEPAPPVIRGTITDELALPLPGVAVHIAGINYNGGTVYDVTTDEAGQFSQVVEPGMYTSPGQYEVTLSKEGYETVHLGPYDVHLDSELVIEQQLSESRPTVPEPPTEVTAVWLPQRTAEVSFSIGSQAGSIALTQAECRNSDYRSERATADASPILVMELTGRRDYMCRVRAKNSVGWGRYSGYVRVG